MRFKMELTNHRSNHFKTLPNWLLKPVVFTILFFAILEVILRVTFYVRNSFVQQVPLPYVIGSDYGPIPPWVQKLSMFEFDDRLLYRARRNLNQKYMDIYSPAKDDYERRSILKNFIPSVPDTFKRNPVWEISLNSEGFRDVELPKKKNPNTFRIICVGDSWTFGANVGQDEAYPQRLQALLNKEYPGAHFEVLNLGVLGYYSTIGVRLLKTYLSDLKPDLIIIGFAMNEFTNSGWKDDDVNPPEDQRNFPDKLLEAVKNIWTVATENLEFYKLLRYWALELKWKPVTMDKLFEDDVVMFQWHKELLHQPKENLETWFQDVLDVYESKTIDMINMAKSHNADVILLYPEFWVDSPFQQVLEKISKTEKVPFIDVSMLIKDATLRIEEEMEENFGLNGHRKLQPIKESGKTVVTFRVYMDDYPVTDSVYISGNHDRLGNLSPNTIAMYDDGTHGDQKAGDKVWSYSVELPTGTHISYVYTNSGREGIWEGLDIPDIRSYTVDGNATNGNIYAPVDSFGKIYMKADPAHPNAYGYELIANEVLDILKNNEKVKKYLNELNPTIKKPDPTRVLGINDN